MLELSFDESEGMIGEVWAAVALSSTSWSSPLRRKSNGTTMPARMSTAQDLQERSSNESEQNKRYGKILCNLLPSRAVTFDNVLLEKKILHDKVF